LYPLYRIKLHFGNDIILFLFYPSTAFSVVHIEMCVEVHSYIHERLHESYNKKRKKKKEGGG